MIFNLIDIYCLSNIIIFTLSFSEGSIISFDSGWHFNRGEEDTPGPVCNSSHFPIDLHDIQCMGLSHTHDATEAQCQDTCCINDGCQTWQFCPMGAPCAAHTPGCWVGKTNDCHNSTDGWISRARDHPIPPPKICNRPECMPSYDDSTWRKLDVPHDWSAEDLPTRNVDIDTPVLTVRNGMWLFKQGDDSSWADPGLDDKNWQKVEIPSDWRVHSNYTKENATGWYRRHISITAALQNVTNLVLALGPAACFDQTYFNGHLIGKSGSTKPSCKDYVHFRSYPIDTSLIKESGNVVAVRVWSQGGTDFPGGLYDHPLLQNGDPKRNGPFDVAVSPGARDTGYSVGGVGWYRKKFFLTKDEQDEKIVSLRFDGCYMNCDMWLNGKHLGNHPYGYTTFQYSITKFLNPPEKGNILAVRVSNHGQNSRWYTGSGIFRHVYLRVTNLIHVPLWGILIRTLAVSLTEATVVVSTTVQNAGKKSITAYVDVELYGPDGKFVANTSRNTAVPMNDSSVVVSQIKVEHPQLWSPETPSVYKAIVKVSSHPPPTTMWEDEVIETFGIRTIEWNAKEGFLLNNKSIKLYGGCMHHDNGPLGSATIDRAEERRVELMKSNGYNAIRTSHNPVSPEFLHACDQIGMLVMDEAFDCWEQGKRPDDYHNYFDKWWKRDMDAMVLRDRNHPSVVIWSIGNEIPMRGTEKGFALAKTLSDYVRTLDPTRPVTSAVPGVSDRADAFFQPLDIAGYNYSPERYVSDHKRMPQRVIVATESFPKQSFDYWEGVWNNDYVIGDFIWTALDYIGESAIGHAANGGPHDTLDTCFGSDAWSWHISYCGDLDICGFKKPQSNYRNVLWNVSKIELAVHYPIPTGLKETVSAWGWENEEISWTWPGQENVDMTVNVYSKHEQVQLLLNGKEIGDPQAPKKLTAQFTVKYTAGTLTAVGINNGVPQSNISLQTAGPPRDIRLTPDRSHISASRNDLAYITVEVVDATGLLVPQARVPITFQISGVGELYRVGNGDPRDLTSFTHPHRNTYRGKALAVLRPKGKGKMILQATSDGLNTGEIVVTAG